MYKRKWFRSILFLFVILLIFGNIVFFNNNQQTVLFHENDSFSNSQISVNVDGIVQDKLPDKNSGKAVSSIVCDKGATGVWNYDHWTIHIKNMTSTRTRCQINFVSKYNEPLLNGTDPVLKEGLIPVTIDNNGVVKKASLGSKWYSYQEKQWANAVILNDASILYADGETIPESNIESYFVWIPKYRYQLWDLGEYNSLTEIDNTKPHEIPIIFGDYDTRDILGECKTPMLSGESGKCKVGDYMTHPAFISMNTTGLWVGKFETGYKGSIDMVSAQKNVVEPGSVQIKPNVNSWRGINVANAFYTSYDYKREMDSHMMKNTEWGVVSYLSHSKYGVQTKVRFNNYENYKTGYVSVINPTCGFTNTNQLCNQYGTDSSVTQPWNTSVGNLGSTTGNITGIYDMSGGAFEDVMGVMLDKNGKPMSGRNAKYNSGFNGSFGCPTCDVNIGNNSSILYLENGKDFFSDKKYYDEYRYQENNKVFNQRILGDATGGMGPFFTKLYDANTAYLHSWYHEKGIFLNMQNPWFVRGGVRHVGIEAGIFNFSSDVANSNNYVSFRIVLSV
jgi:hypothetical protein